MIVPCSSCGTPNRIPPERLGRQAKCGKCKQALTPGLHPYPLASSAEFGELIGKSPVPVLVDFWAPWCGPCHTVAPELENIARERKGQVMVVKLNTEEHPDVAARFAIRALPTFVLFKGGQEQSRASGAMHAKQIETTLGL
ncbi:MAG TPA: thioredoxin TrxC [Polyangiaceae bacterium]|nr:thioredoxin TrxC [Polyangiaceae bacterium]